MSQLKVYLKTGSEQKLLHVIELQSGVSYLGGRGEGVDIKLPDERGLSRQHFQLTSEGETWKMTSLAKYGKLTYLEKVVPELLLMEQMNFSMPPLFFEFTESRIHAQPSVDFSIQDTGPSHQVLSLAPEEERTFVGVVPQVAFLRLLTSDDVVLQIYQLEGETWVAGRETSCAIFIDRERISRKHFEIRRQEHVYFVRDLGSANGTFLNGTALIQDEWQQITSGDSIKVADVTLRFELRDAQYEDRLVQAQQLMNSPAIYGSGYSDQNYEPQVYLNDSQFNSEMAYDAPDLPPSDLKSKALFYSKILLKKENRVRVAIGGVLLIALVFSSFDDSSDKKTAQRSVASDKVAKTNGDFLKLKPEQQDYVKQTHKLAKELLMQGRYEMARQEILKIHQFVNLYEDSADIENTAVQGIQLQQEKARAEAREREKIEIEEKISRQLEVCKAKLNPNIEADEIDTCLSSVVQFNPEHSGIQALKSKVDQIVSERKIREAQKADYAAKAARQKALYQKALELNRSGQLLQAVKAFEEVSSSALPDPQGLKPQARREIASIQQTLSEKQSLFETQAEASYKKGELKDAISFLKKSEEINPDNEVTKSKVVTMMSELKKQMQTLYQEGILEESVGEVESAKTKWRKIIKLSLPDEEYYKKATIKLKKYGAL